jgi:hypothetical protein
MNRKWDSRTGSTLDKDVVNYVAANPIFSDFGLYPGFRSIFCVYAKNFNSITLCLVILIPDHERNQLFFGKRFGFHGFTL